MTSRNGVGAAEIWARYAGKTGNEGNEMENLVMYSSRLVLLHQYSLSTGLPVLYNC